MMATKKVNYLTLEKKAQLLSDVSKGFGVTCLSKKYGIAKSTVCAIKNKKAQITSTVAMTFSGASKRKSLRPSEYPKMEKALYRWFLRQRERNAPISGLILKEKAKYFHGELYGDQSTFSASSGWLQKFKKRFGIRFLTITGEKLSSQPELVSPFLQKLAAKIKDLNLDYNQVYNADETGLCWKLLPGKTYVSAEEKTAPGRKTAKERITFLACTNATGLHKLTPLVIGKAKNPRSFKNSYIPVHYKHSQSAWMTAGIFKEWFNEMFVPEVRKFLRKQGLPEKALLLLDNAPSHPPEEQLSSDDGLIHVMYMPPNVTPLIQPMDQNVIRLAKLHYRSMFLAMVVANKSNDINVVIKQYNLRDAILNLSRAWNKLEPPIIKKCWKNILESQHEDDPEDNIPLATLRQELLKLNSVVETNLNLLNEIDLMQDFHSADIEEWNKDNFDERDENCTTIDHSDDSEIECVTDQNEGLSKDIDKISHVEAIRIFNRGLEWAEQNNADIEDIQSLQKLREHATILSTKQRFRQTKLDYFLKKN